MAYLHRGFQEAHRAHGVLHLLRRHGGGQLLRTGQQVGGLERWAVHRATGEGWTGEVGLVSPRDPAQLPGDEREEAQQCQATKHEHTEQQSKSRVWWRAAGTGYTGSHNMDKQMAVTRGREGHRGSLLENNFSNGLVLFLWFYIRQNHRAKDTDIKY